MTVSTTVISLRETGQTRVVRCNWSNSNRCSNHNLGSSSWRKIIVVISDFPINFCFTFFSLFLYSVLKVLVATVSLIPRLPISPFDVTNPRFGSGGSPLVGSNGLEPSTSRLSGVRSNHLSYEPISVAVRCAIRPNHLWLRSVPFRDYCLPFRSDCNATWLGASPWWRRTESNCRPPACKAGALPAELRPHIRFVPLGKSTLLSSLGGPSKLNSAKLTR